MARKSPEELAEAKRRAKEKREQEERESELQILEMDKQRIAYLGRRNTFTRLRSDLDGIYDEIDKLTKKSPVDPITKIQVESINEIVAEIKILLNTDESLKKVSKFIPAGDNPENRDALFVLRLLKQAMQRYETSINYEAESVAKQIRKLCNSRVEDLAHFSFKDVFGKDTFIDSSIFDQLT